jgi:hypothetical protein
MIEKLYRGKCSGPCERWLPRPDVVHQVAATESTSGAYLAVSDVFIKDEAVRRGWQIFPLTCPDCLKGEL